MNALLPRLIWNIFGAASLLGNANGVGDLPPPAPVHHSGTFGASPKIAAVVRGESSLMTSFPSLILPLAVFITARFPASIVPAQSAVGGAGPAHDRSWRF